ncbi:hypothetical protein K466DRAFT_567434 [Polyporus arcularius HHB13444]|uniref:Uncharacterized protein n=1 Tax=Polyporus arcularius HHB13444 TaxID=1314778 RepID=A0A5C3P508_9APHY|nr:hypothetical protein K466DRAFT_567434 [Polyporus arcularius HHB13444]
MPALRQEVTIPSFSFPAQLELQQFHVDASFEWERIKELFRVFIRDMSEAASNGVAWVKEHPEEVKNTGLVCAAVVVLALTLYALAPAICLLLGAVIKLVFAVLKLLHSLVMIPIELVLRSFTPSGVRPNSVASHGQSALYGPNTNGFFSTMQSAGARRR